MGIGVLQKRLVPFKFPNLFIFLAFVLVDDGTMLRQDIVTESESFDVERFIPLLQKYIRRTNPYIRQLLVSTCVSGTLRQSLPRDAKGRVEGYGMAC